MEKIKALFNKLLQNKKLLWITIGSAVALIAVIAIIIALLTGGSDSGLTGCTVAVKSEGGMALEGIGVYVYTDEAKTELIGYSKTDENGTVNIDQMIPEGSIAILEDVPAGYTAQESYPITASPMEIILPISLLEEMTALTPGSVMFDFTVTDTDGIAYTLSELLKEKKAVVLNLWYTGCQPCKMEFPFLQNAYQRYADDIALIAINPDSSDDEAGISAYKSENNLTMPMAKVDGNWNNVIENIAFPTTIIIDRFGTVGLIHIGSIDNTETFANAFAFFTAENYIQTVVEDIKSIETAGGNQPQGTKDDPLEFAGVTEFEVIVPAGETVYCNVYRVAGMELKVESANVKVGFNDTEYTPNEGIVSLQIPASTDPNTPALIGFTNTGSAEETFKVTFSAGEGTMENPLKLVLGDTTASVAAGNAQGVHYTYAVDKEGTFTLTLKNAPEGVEYGIALNNLTTSKYLTLDEDAKEDEDGNKTLSFSVMEGDEVQLVISVIPNDKDEYPAAEVGFNTAIVTEEDATQEETTPVTTAPPATTTPPVTTAPPTTVPAGPNYDGKLVNPDKPIEISGSLEFDAEDIKGGEMKLYNVYRVGGTVLQVKDPDVYIIYDDELYKPNSSGYIYISMQSEDPRTPEELMIGNSGTGTKTFGILFYYPKGTRMNPYDLSLGQLTVDISRNDDQGRFYSYKAAASGTFTIEVLSASGGATASVSITNGSQQETLEDGATTVSITVNAGDELIIVFNTAVDANFNSPASTLTLNASIA